VAADQQQRQIEAQQQMQQQQLQMQQQMSLENREDMQASRIDEINAKTEGQIRIDDKKMGKQMIVDTNNIEQKAVYDNKTKTYTIHALGGSGSTGLCYYIDFKDETPKWKEH
jgi:hypothetical protein